MPTIVKCVDGGQAEVDLGVFTMPFVNKSLQVDVASDSLQLVSAADYSTFWKKSSLTLINGSAVFHLNETEQISLPA